MGAVVLPVALSGGIAATQPSSSVRYTIAKTACDWLRRGEAGAGSFQENDDSEKRNPVQPYIGINRQIPCAKPLAPDYRLRKMPTAPSMGSCLSHSSTAEKQGRSMFAVKNRHECVT